MGDNNENLENKNSSVKNKTANVLQGTSRQNPPELRWWQKLAYIFYFIVLFLVLISLLLALWPPSVAAEGEVTPPPEEEIEPPEEEAAPVNAQSFSPQEEPEEEAKKPDEKAEELPTVDVGPLPVTITEDVRFILIVAVMGALGGCTYSARSFAYHVAGGTFDTRYTCWYILRPIFGSILAIIFYFAFHAAFLSFSASPDDLNVFGVATLGGIVGLFSKETLDKLKELFDRIVPIDQQDQGS